MVTKDMLISDIISMNSEFIEVLLEAGMHCISCPAAMAETLEEACMVHGIDVDEIVNLLNVVGSSKPAYTTTVIENDIHSNKEE